MKRRFGSLGFKIVSIIIVVLAASVSAALFMTVRTTRDNLLGTVRRNLSVNNEILTAVIRNLMLGGEAPIAVQTLDGIKAIEEFKEVSIYRADGTAAFSDYQTLDLVNSYQSDHVFDRTPRLDKVMLDNRDFRAVLETNAPRQVEIPSERKMEYFFPILNYSQCRECHGESPFIRGIAYYEVSTAGAYKSIQSAGTSLAALLSGTGVFIALTLILLMRRIVVRPIRVIGEAVGLVGAGNLDVSIELRGRDEFGELGAKINGMIEGLKLRDRLVLENRTIEARNQENRKYLDNIGQGLLLLGSDLRIREQYSAFLVGLFGVEKPAGMSFLDFIYPDPGLREEREELEKFLGMVFFKTLTEMEMINSINPLRDKRLSVPDGRGGRREIVVDALFARIPEGESVGSVMVIFDDRTQIVRAKEELAVQRELRDAELEEIAAILKAGPEAFAGFVAEAIRVLELLRAGLPRLSEPELAASLFRELHSLKGSARYFELKSLARHAHLLEEAIGARRLAAGEARPGPELEELLGRLVSEVENLRSVNERFKAFRPASAPESGRGGKAELEAFLRQLEEMAKSLAAELGKDVRVHCDNEIGELEALPKLRNGLLHLVRNAVDHGIEEELERVSEGKEGTGLIRIRLHSPKPGEAAIEVEDDGRGIDFKAIRAKALRLGLLAPNEEPSQERLLQFIFQGNFSSRDTVTELSGRGVGLEVVKELVRSLGGRIAVRTESHKGTRFTIRFPLGGET